ncbi:MAG: hypothetical protein C0502_08430 [Opitutus sp.]|nr:hypothetical protein [Opitutus sp.]
MHRRLALLVVLGCAVSATAQDAPLAGAKQQLQQLSKDRAADEAKAQSGIKLGSLPQLQVQPKGGDAPQLAAPPPQANQKQPQDESRNWLLQGYDRLGPKPDRRDKDARREDTELLDPRSPDYFLKVYERQRAERQGKTKEEATERLGTSAAPDVMSPFMQDWLARSPVKGILKDTTGGRNLAPDAAVAPGTAVTPQGQTVSVATQDPSAEADRRLAESRGGSVKRAARANPYVQALGVAPDGLTGNTLELPSPTASPTPVAKPPAAPTLTLPELPKVEPRRRPPPSPADDKKYFPQLKKF